MGLLHATPVRYRLRRLVALLLGVLSLTLALQATAPAVADEPFQVRGAYGEDDSPSGYDDIVAAGFNTINSGAYVELLDQTWAMGLHAVVWLGPYDADTCSFERSDDWIREYVGNVAGHPSIIAYQLDDEPGYERAHNCPQVTDQLRARSDLVKSIDPDNPTYVTVSTWDGVEEYPYQYFRDTADIIGLVNYPCSHQYGCRFDDIDESIAEADADGLDRYWAVLQAYESSWYQLPTYEELRAQVERWSSSSRMEGYFIYEWPGGLETYGTTALAALDSRFSDVPRGDTFYDEIHWLAEQRITGGCNPPLYDRFCPGEPVTRGQMAAFLVRALGYSAGGSGDSFVDDNDSVFEVDIEKLLTAGVTQGCNPPVNDRFCPDKPVTREQMAAFLTRALG